MIAAVVIPLIGGIWCAELNADRFAIDAQGTPKHLTGALDKLAPRSSWWRWILFRMSHPPLGLRRWASRRSGQTNVLIALLLIFPLAYVAKAAAMTGWGLSLYLSQCVLGCDMAAVWKELGANVGYLLDGYVRVWLAMAVLLLVWPVVGGYWERVFSGLSERKLASRSRGYSAYLLSAALACVLAISCYILLLPS